MAHDKKHRSFKDLFGSAGHALSLHSSPSNNSDNGTASHRSFLRSRSSKTSLHSSTSSLASQIGSPVDSGSSQHHASDTESTHSASSVSAKPKKQRKKKLASNDSHHSLKRFFKKLQPHHSNAPKSAPVAPVASSKLAENYDVGALIGAGASGSVSLLTSKHDGRVYALKKFRSKLKNESEPDYMRKVKNEFLVGEYLKQQNLIHTLEMIQETPVGASHPDFYIVMEYCPYDFFNLVMSGLMSKEEIYCYFKQITLGVEYLHKSGIAHRDLKLDNCVVDENGVLKLIDFGSAFQFRKAQKDHPSQQEILTAKGIVGSDPYLAPEIISQAGMEGYDPRLADVWSIAIIFCCMMLKRFPWKLPRASDPSYRSFAAITENNEPVSESEMLSSSAKELSVSKTPLPKYGPERLLRTLPSASRQLIGKMLEISVAQRIFIGDVVNDPFFQSIEHCHYSDLPPKATEFADENTLVSGHNSPRDSLEASETTTKNNSEAGTPQNEEFTSWQDRPFVAGRNHKHHLITEKELQKINADRAKAKKAKEEKEGR